MPLDATVRDRLEGCIWGMFAGDAWCLGSHWIYDADAFAARFPHGPAGFDEPAPGHYHAGKRPGELTHYGEGALVLLTTLAGHGVDPDAYGRALLAHYARPDNTSYVDKPTRHLLEARRRCAPDAPFADGADDDQNVTASRLAPLVALRAGDPRLMTDIDAVTRVLQDNDRAVAYACAHARLLEELLAGGTLDAAVERLDAMLDRRTTLGAEIGGQLDAARAARDADVTATTAGFGRACRLVQAFPAALQAALAHGDDLAAAVRATGLARGDNASRAMLIGSWLGARHGTAAVPAAWRAQLADGAAIEAALARLLRRREPTPATAAQ